MESVTPVSEEVLYTGTVSRWNYAGRWLVILLLLALTAATFFQPVALAGWSPWILRGVLVAAALGLYLWMWLDRSRRKYTVTSLRVSVEFGILSKNSKEMRIDHIRSIDLSTSGLSGLVGIGRLEFSSSEEEDDVIFWSTPKAQAIRDLVRSLQARS